MHQTSDRENIFRRVYEHVYPIIFRIAFRITSREDVAEELCQEAFIKYYDRIDTFPDADQAKYWLIRVAKNLALNAAKRAGRERRAYERVFHEPGRTVATGEDQLIRQESQEQVHRGLQRLPDKMRAVLVLKEYGQLNYKEIGAILSITEGNVKVRVFRARERLMELLDEDAAHEA
ncbi:MAG: RNA polymerase sigma factor [Spirochaetales bacterium]|nr:MAG: RNA polymerase sigma factor [Spirochaetales bacterium]